MIEIILVLFLISYFLGYYFDTPKGKAALAGFLLACASLIGLFFSDFITFVAFMAPFFLAFLIVCIVIFFVGKRFGSKAREDFVDPNKSRRNPFE